MYRGSTRDVSTDYLSDDVVDWVTGHNATADSLLGLMKNLKTIDNCR